MTTATVAPDEAGTRKPRDAKAIATRALLVMVALYTFVGALQIMKTGATGLSFLQPGGFLIRNAVSTFGLGWLGALIFLSGSPVAATSLTFVASDRITEAQGFTMLSGSRMGAAFVVLVTAVIYAVRSGAGGRMKPLSTAVMALSATAVIYLPSLATGLFLLRETPFRNLELSFGGGFESLLSFLYGGLLGTLDPLTSWLVFLVGVAVLLGSFKLIDRALPQIDGEALGSERIAWLRRKWPMFGLGCLVALVTMSVSVALTILVPLVARGYAKREDILPYIIGANITTLGDTMFAAFALGSPGAVRIVLAEVISTSLLSVGLLAFAYPQLRSGLWRFQRSMVKSRVRLTAFTGALFLVPLALVLAA